MKKHIISVMLIAGTVALCGCSANNGTSSDIQSSSQSESQQTAEAATSKVETAEAPAESSVLADLTGTYDDVSEKFEFSDGWSNGSMFNCTWRKSNGSIFDGSMKLTIDKDLLDKPLLHSRQSKIQEGMRNWFGRDLEELNIVGSYNLLFNASLMVEEGVGYALCLDKLINTSGDSGLCFRPLAGQAPAGMDLVWKKYQVFTSAAEGFIRELRAGLEGKR